MENGTLLQESLVNFEHGAATVQAKAAGVVSQFSGGINAWTIVLSLLLGAVVYDQGMGFELVDV